MLGVINHLIDKKGSKDKMFRNILLLYSEKVTEDHINMVKKIRADLKKFKLNVNTINIKYIEKKFLNDIDLVMTIGGDGTFIRAAHFLYQIPILGINSEPDHSEGALLIRYEELEKILKDNSVGKIKLTHRNRIKTLRNNVLLEELALNEVYVGTEKQFTTSRYIINYRNYSEEQRSSGVLVVTSSGSHSWYKSAGGIPFDEYDNKRLKFIVREPYIGKIYNPKILTGELLPDEIISFYSRRYDGGAIAIDSYKVYPFNIGDVVEISMSNIPLNIVSP